MKETGRYIPDRIPADWQTELISVIVPVYNVAPYLPQCLDSILKQTYKNLEIILVDDASTDGSSEICDEYAGKDSRIRVVHKPVNEGPGAARNAGMELAAGTWLTFVDSDDWIDEEMYRVMLSALLDADADIAVCRYRRIYADRAADSSSGEAAIYGGQELLEAYILNADRNRTVEDIAWNKLYRRSLADGMRFPVGLIEDVPFTTQLLSRVRRGVCLDTAYYNYRADRSDSIMNGTPVEELWSVRRFRYREQIRFLSRIGQEDLARAKERAFYWLLLQQYRTAAAQNLPAAKQQQIRAEVWEEIRRNRKTICALYRLPAVSVRKFIEMRLFLLSPRYYCGSLAVIYHLRPVYRAVRRLLNRFKRNYRP